MCVPAAMAVPLMIASTVVSTAGTLVSAIGQSQQANYAAQVADRNRAESIRQGNDAQANTALEAQRRYRLLAQTKGQQQAAMAANGVDLNFGSPLDIQRDTAMIGAEDVGQIYKAGSEKVRGYDIQGWNYAAEANADKAKASGAIVNGIFGAASTALGGATQVSKMKAGLNNYSFGG